MIRRTMSQSTAPRRWWARQLEMEVNMMLASEVAVLDHHRGEVWLIANAINYNASDEGVERAYVGAVAAVERMAEALRQPREPLVVEEGEARAARAWDA